MEDCIFCKIIKGKIPAVKVWENDEFFVFLDRNPINPGHTLVLPKKHVDYIFDLDEKLLNKILMVSKPIAKAIAKAFPPATGKVGIMVEGLGVAHAHVHLIPMNTGKDLNFDLAKKDIPMEEIKANAEEIKQALQLYLAS